jgi:hypothetical protein
MDGQLLFGNYLGDLMTNAASMSSTDQSEESGGPSSAA